MSASSTAVPPKIKSAPSLPMFAAVILGVAFAGACTMIFFFSPNKYGFYPVCMFHELTGLNCPGCGGTRAVYALLHGHFEAALRDNGLFVLLLPVAALRGVWLKGKKVLGQPSGRYFTPRILWGLLVVTVAFGVLRNLPWFWFMSP